MTAAPGPQQPDEVCMCGHGWDAAHEQTTLMGGTCAPSDGSSCTCPGFRSGATEREVEASRQVFRDAGRPVLAGFITATHLDAARATATARTSEQREVVALTAEIHEAWEFQYAQCDHGTYTGGPNHGQPYAMCELAADRIVRRRAALLAEQPDEDSRRPRVTLTFGSLNGVKTARRRYRCGSHLADRHHIEVGEQYVASALPPHDPEICNDRWLHLRVCMDCCPVNYVAGSSA